MSELKEDSIVTLEVFDNPVSAHIVKARLEANDIPCFLKDEHTIGMNALYSQALGGVKLMVFSRDVGRCAAILAEDESLISENEPTEADNAVCPNCQSTDVGYGNATKRRFNLLTMLASVLLLVYPFHSNKAWHCYNCGEEF